MAINVVLLVYLLGVTLCWNITQTGSFIRPFCDGKGVMHEFTKVANLASYSPLPLFTHFFPLCPLPPQSLLLFHFSPLPTHSFLFHFSSLPIHFAPSLSSPLPHFTLSLFTPPHSLCTLSFQLPLSTALSVFIPFS